MNQQQHLIIAAATRRELKGALGPLGSGFALAGDGRGRVVLRGEEFLLLETGIGPVNAAFALGLFLGENRGRVKGVVNVGVAGSFDLDRVGLRQRVVVRTEIWPEFGLWGEGGIDPRGLGLPLGRGPGGPIWDGLTLDPEKQATDMGCFLPPDWPRVASVTVAGVSGIPARAKALQKRYNPDIENMEGFALAWGCHRAGVPFLQCRTISNRVGAREGWDLEGAVKDLGGMLAALLGQA